MKSVEEIILEIERRLKEIDDTENKYLEDVDYAQYHELKTLLSWIKRDDDEK